MLLRLLFSKNSILITSADITSDEIEAVYDIYTNSSNQTQHERMLKGVLQHLPKHFKK